MRQARVLVDMGATFATVTEDDGVLMTVADVNGFTFGELRFPPDYVQDTFEPELPYLAIVVDGALTKVFRHRTMHLDSGCALTVAVGARHRARFGPEGARIAIVKANGASNGVARSLDRVDELRGRGFGWLGRRLAAELRAPDAAAPLAAEGLGLELLAAVRRDTDDRPLRSSPPWLRSAEELLRTRIGDRIGLSELAEAVSVHPAHLARAFRARYGVSVGEYGRRLRMEWAAAEVARGDRPLAEIAAAAGFADQSHFTRLFRRYVGTTPAMFRAFQAR